MLPLCLSSSLLAQQPAKEYKGHFLTSQGQIQANGHTVGTISKEGIIRDANGTSPGRMAEDGMTFYDENGVSVVTLNDQSGKTRDLVDARGKIVGNVYDSMKGNACAIHCFQTQMTTKPEHSKMKMNP